MAEYSLVVFGWSWTEVGVLGIQAFGKSSVDSCGVLFKVSKYKITEFTQVIENLHMKKK